MSGALTHVKSAVEVAANTEAMCVYHESIRRQGAWRSTLSARKESAQEYRPVKETAERIIACPEERRLRLAIPDPAHMPGQRRVFMSHIELTVGGDQREVFADGKSEIEAIIECGASLNGDGQRWRK